MIKPVVYQRVTYDQVEDDYFYNHSTNPILKAAFEKYGWDAFEPQFGYRVDDNNMYICVDPSYEVEVDGQAYDAEEALDQFPISDLEDYITDGDSTTIRRYLSGYELSKDIDYDDLAYYMLGEGYTLKDLVDGVQEANLKL